MPRDPKFSVERTPPQNIELEMCVLGGIMLEPKNAYQVASDILSKESFYLDGHGVIFEMMGELHERGTPPDSDMVLDELRSRGLLEQVGGAAVVLAMLNSVPSAASVEYHSKKLASKAHLRALIRGCTQIIEECYRQEMSDLQIMEQAEQTVINLSRSMCPSGTVHIKQAVDEYFAGLNERRDTCQECISTGKPVPISAGLPAGYKDLDQICTGFKPTEVTIIAARTSMGKTAFAFNIARNVAALGVPVLAFSLEMGADQLTERLLSLGSHHTNRQTQKADGISNTQMQTGNIPDGDGWEALKIAAQDTRKLPLYLSDVTVNIGSLKSIARQHHIKHHIGLVIVDYLQLISPPNIPNREQQVSSMSRGLKELARDLKIPVVVLSQLKRAESGQRDRRPELSDLRESGAIEHDASVVMFLHRKSYYDKQVAQQCSQCHGFYVAGRCDQCGHMQIDSLEVIVSKNRNGPTDTVTMAWIPALGMFAPAARKYAE